MVENNIPQRFRSLISVILFQYICGSGRKLKPLRAFMSFSLKPARGFQFLFEQLERVNFLPCRTSIGIEIVDISGFGFLTRGW